MNTKGYNGYTNYETWAVALWIDNDQWLADEINEMAKKSLENVSINKITGNDMSAYEFTNELKAVIEEMAPDLGASLWADLLNGALSEVAWNELSDIYRKNATEEVA